MESLKKNIKEGLDRILKKLEEKKNEKKFETVAEAWLKSKKNSVKLSTYYNYSYSVEKYLYPEFAGKDITKIRDCNDFIDDLLDTLAPKTVRDIISKLNSIFKYYEDEKNVKLKIKKMSLPKLVKRKIQILSKKEKYKLEKYCLEENNLKTLGILICLNTGIRIGELCALKWENINLEERKIYIKKTIERVYIKKEKKTKIIIDTPKSNSSIREIPINNKLYEILKKMKGKSKKNEYVLTGSDTHYIEPRNYQYHFKVILKKSKIKASYKFHALRHTFATICIEIGMDIKSLSEILGHADVSVTLNVYVHSSDKLKRKFLEKL